MVRNLYVTNLLLPSFRIDKDGSLDIGFSEWRDFLLFHPTADLKEIIQYWRHSTVILCKFNRILSSFFHYRVKLVILYAVEYINNQLDKVA